MGLFPSSPTFTEKELPDQSNNVFLVTGATGGVGLELASILFGKHARVYLAARSAEKAQTAIASLKTKHPDSKGELRFVQVDFSDLISIKGAAASFMSQEDKLHVLWNNAGVMIPPQGSKTKQGYELQLGTNNLGSFLFTKLLQPALDRAAAAAPPGSVRVVWVSSSAAGYFAPAGGVDMSNLDYSSDRFAIQKYGVSKAGNILHAAEYARRHAQRGILSVALDPGNLATDLYRELPWWQYAFVKLMALHPAINGAYTELFAGLSPAITAEDNGCWVEPFGVIGRVRRDIGEACRDTDGGSESIAAQFWKWTEEQVRPYA